jgi:prophage antirepressor-like protein
MNPTITTPTPPDTAKSDRTSVYRFGNHEVRTAGSWDAPLFCAADVCSVLGYVDVSQACERLDQDEVEKIEAEKGSQRTLYRGPNANMYLTESGLFSLILGSNKPEAKAFKKWVTSEVLPEIRKHGYYNALEIARRRQTEQLLTEIFPNLPSKAEPMFRELITALLRLRREPDSPGNPPWARMLASWHYGWAFPIDGEQQHRRALNTAPNGSRLDHSMLSDDGRTQLQRVVDVGVAFTRISPTWEAWKANMELTFGKKATQLPLMVPMLYAVPSAPEPAK